MDQANRRFPLFFTLSLKLAVLLAVLFFLCRVCFVSFNTPPGNHEASEDYLSAFFMGLRFDLIIISYLLMLPALIVVIHEVFLRKQPVVLTFVRAFLLVICFPSVFIACADIPYFSQFGSHINKSVTVWKMSPGYTLKLIFSSFYYWGFALLFLVVYVVFILLVNRLFKKHRFALQEIQPVSAVKNSIFFLALAFLLFAAARGRLASKSTMHEGMAIVSQNAFVNQIALNPNFTLIKSLGRKELDQTYLNNIEEDLKQCAAFFNKNYFPENGKIDLAVISPARQDSLRRLNVIVVLMESLNMAKMGYYNNPNLSPYLTELAGESVFFDRFFSSGIHTFNGLFSSNCGFPSIYTEHSLRDYTKQPFITLATLLKPQGYHSFFGTTHDAVFDNMEGFFKLNGYDEVISESDFSITESIGVTGVPDHLLYKKLIERINSEKQISPFVACIMTGTDHGPWKIPEDIPFKPNAGSDPANASLYADWAVGQFLEEAKKQPWYKNTVFAFLGDHGQIMNDPYDMPITYHHIPFIVHCPLELKSGVNHHLGYQPDIVKTIVSVLKLDYRNFSFGDNILVRDRPFVFFSADDKLGFVTDDDLFFYHTLSDNNKKFVKYRELNTENLYQQNKLRADSLYTVMQSLYNSARYYIKQNYSAN